ncbi:MAG: glycosyltransferase 61 family protein [Candidatus Gastranaerophilaceae bacterium]
MDPYVQKLLLAVDFHYKDNDYEKAKSLYLEIIKEYPEKIDAYYYLGMLEAESDNLNIAIDWMQKLIDIAPFDQAYNALAKFYLIKRDLVRSLKYLKLALIYNSKDEEAKDILNKVFPKESRFIKSHNLSSKNEFIMSKDHPDCKYKMMYPADTIERKSPKYVESILTPKQKKLFEYALSTTKTAKWNEAFVLEVKNGRAYIDQGSQTYIITQDDKYLKDMLEPECRPLNLDHIPPEIQIADKILVLSSSFGGNFFHWATWAIPRIYMIEKAGYNLQEFDKIFINYVGFKFQKNLIKILGIPMEKVIGTMPKGGLFKAKTLVTASLSSYLNTPCYITESFRAKFLKEEYYSEDRPKIIYLSRNKGSRRILNEQELINYLNNMGFQVVYPESMSYEEQIAAFANAEVILTQHGAGLTNLCFCKPSTKVIEIFNENFENFNGQVPIHFFGICSNLNLDHYIMFGEPISQNNLDMTIDLKKLEKTIDLILSDNYISV